jgi:DNA-binding GntR family transcriptional regulator
VPAIARVPLYQQAYLDLRSRIASGEFKPGARVDVQTIADELEISRTPVREAIRQLLQDGLLEASRDGRVSVFSPSPEQLAEIYIARASLEATSVSVALRSGVSIDTSELRSTVERAAAAMSTDDWQTVVQANSSFHEWLMGLSHSGFIQRIMGSSQIYVTRYRGLSMQFPHRQAAAQAAHEEILRLLDANDESVAAYIYEHVSLAGGWAIQNLKPDAAADTPSMACLRRTWEEYSTDAQH